MSVIDDEAERLFSSAPKAPDMFAGAVATKAHPKTLRGRTSITVRFKSDLLERVDVAAHRRGISRSAWIQYTLSKALDDEAK